eukprot:1031781-Amphidinium_carterae.1
MGDFRSRPRSRLNEKKSKRVEQKEEASHNNNKTDRATNGKDPITGPVPPPKKIRLNEYLLDYTLLHEPDALMF